MKKQNIPAAWLILGLVTLACGYVWWSGDSAEEGELSETEAPALEPVTVQSSPQPPPKPPRNTPQPEHGQQRGRGGSEAKPRSVSPELPDHPAPATPVVTSEPTVKSGDRFAFLKTIEERVTQFAADGPVESRSTLELFLAIRVEDVQPDGSKRFTVEYQRVRYSRSVAGETIEYDSAAAAAAVPPEARTYQAMLGNGFSFQLAADGRVRGVEGVRELLENCTAHLPAGERRQTLERFAEAAGENALADFIDGSIGLIPLDGQPVAPGAQWKRVRELRQPVPLRLTDRCMLKNLRPDTAVIDIAGVIEPSGRPQSVQPAAGAMRIEATGGRSMGWCTIDRTTGLPRNSRIARDLEMIVHLPTGESLRQRKSTVTTFEAVEEE